jgi:tRNA pseudouridine55 synthase
VGGVVFKTASPEAESPNSASSRINVTDNSALGLPRAEIRMACSKGTYVRAFARDLGEALGSGAHLDSLQRSRSGIFRVENALSVEEAIQKLQ